MQTNIANTLLSQCHKFNELLSSQYEKGHLAYILCSVHSVKYKYISQEKYSPGIKRWIPSGDSHKEDTITQWTVSAPSL